MQETNRLKASGNAVSSGIPGKGWGSLRSAFELFRKRKLFVFASFLIIALVLFSVIKAMNKAAELTKSKQKKEEEEAAAKAAAEAAAKPTTEELLASILEELKKK